MNRAHTARRNELLLVLEGTLFWAGMAFLQGDTVISRFMDSATGSIALAGLAATLRSVMPMIGQFVMGMFIHRVKKQSRLMGILGFMNRPFVLLMTPLLLMGLSGKAAAVTLLIIYSIIFLIDGAIGLLWIELCTRTLAPRRRGEIMSTQQMLGGMAGFLAGIVLSRIMGSQMSFQMQYAVIFGIAGTILAIESVALSKLVDAPHPYEPEKPVPKLNQYLGRLIPLVTKDKPVRTILIARALYVLTLISAPLNVVFGREMGGLNEAQLAMLVFMPVIGQTTSGILWAQVCKRMGYPAMMLMAHGLGILCALMNMVCYAMAMSGLPIMVPLSMAMILVSVNTPAYMGFMQQMVLMAKEERRSDTIVMASLMLAPLSFGTYIAGVIVEKAGYLPVYALMLAGGLLGLMIVYRYFLSKKTRFPGVE